MEEIRKSMVFYRSFVEATDSLEAEMYKRVVQAILHYGIYGTEPQLEGIENSLFMLVKPQIEANNARYENGKKGAEFGKMGGRPKKEKPLENPTKTPKDNANVNDKDNEKDNAKEECRKIMQMFNDICISYPTLKHLSLGMEESIAKALKTFSLSDIQIAFENAEASEFMKGKNNNGWVASFDWIIKEENLVKIINGNYENKTTAGTQSKIASELDNFYKMSARWAADQEGQ